MENADGPAYNAEAMSQPTEPAAIEFETIALVGVGLIGGSIGRAVKRLNLARTVIGVGRDAVRLEKARRLGIVDVVTHDLAEAARKSDLIVVCTPVDQIVAGVRNVAEKCRAGTLLTDAGSVKESICRELASGLPDKVEFIGSHPLAGSERQGFENSDAELFTGRVCVVTPLETSTPEAVARIERFWRSLGSDVLKMTPADHDRALAETSHLPHLVAAALAGTLAPHNRNLAATGFRDTTRIAMGDPELWAAILLANAVPILAGLDKFEAALREYQQALQRRDATRVRKLLSSGKTNRESLGRS